MLSGVIWSWVMSFHSSPVSVRFLSHKQQKPTYSFKQKSYKKQMGSSEFLGWCGIKLKLSTKNNALSWATRLFRKFILVALSLWRIRAIKCLHSMLGKNFSSCVVTYGNVWNSQSWWTFCSSCGPQNSILWANEFEESSAVKVTRHNSQL